MQQTAYNTLTAVLFLAVALLHLLRIIFGWSAQIGDVSIPMWASWLVLVVTAALAYFGFRQHMPLGDAKG